MKQIICEMCGSNNLVKTGDNFVCQDCGTKYTVEAAKKLMVEVEGKVDVSGSSVTIDNSAAVQNYLANARRAKQKEDWSEMERYYNLVEQNDPSNIEAIFYSSYGKAKQTLVSSDLYKRQAEFKVLNNSVSIIDDNFNVDKAEEQIAIVKQISDDIIKMMYSSFVFNQTKNGYGIVIRTDKNSTYNLFINLSICFNGTLENIYKKLREEQVSEKIEVIKLRLIQYKYLLDNEATSKENKQIINDSLIPSLHKLWNKVDETHEIPEFKTLAQVKAEKKAEQNKETAEKWAKQLPAASIIFAFLFPLIGLIYGIMGFSRASKGIDGYTEKKNTYLIAIIISIVWPIIFGLIISSGM